MMIVVAGAIDFDHVPDTTLFRTIFFGGFAHRCHQRLMRGTQLGNDFLSRASTPSIPHRFVEEIQIPGFLINEVGRVRNR